MKNILEIQKKLVENACVSGNENKIAHVIAEMVKPYADEIRIDALGNLIVRKKGNGKKIMMAAHMDSIGLMVTDIDDKGFAYFNTLGGFMADKLRGSYVKFQNGTVAMIGKTFAENSPVTKLTDLYLDFGSNSKAETEKLVQVGDTCVFCGSPTQIQGDKIAGPYMDDLIGCTALILAIQKIKNNTNDLYFVFTVQEEVGLRGAKTSTYAINPDYGFCIDVTMCGDYPEAPTPKNPAKLGGGPAIKIKDGSVICNPQVVTAMKNAAKKAKIPYQIDILAGAGTDAGAMQTTRGGILTGGISIAARYIHTQMETVSLVDVQATVDLVCEFVETDLAEV